MSASFFKQMESEVEEKRKTEAPVEKPIETPTEKPVETPVEKPVETPIEKPVETSVEKPTETLTETLKEEPKEKKVIKTILGTTEINEEEEEIKTKFESAEPDKFIEAVNKELGSKATSLTDVFGLLEQTKELESVRKDKEEYETKSNSYEKLFEAMPKDVLKIVEDALLGRDYKTTIKSFAGSNVDYTKSINAYEKNELISLYNDVSEDDYEDMSEKQVNLLYNNAKLIYEKEQKEFNTSSDSFTENQKNTAKSFIVSVEESTDNMANAYPSIDKKELSAVSNIMKKGINTLLFTEEGKYKKDAAKLIMLGTHGENIIKQITEQYEKELKRKIKKAQSEKAEEIISNTQPDGIKPTQNNATSISIDASVEKGMPFLKKIK